MSAFSPAAALKHQVILIGGAEGFLVRRALGQIIAEMGITEDDYDLETVFGDGASMSSILASVCTLPFLSPRRTVVVRNCGRLDAGDVTAAQLKSIPESGLLLLVADEEGGSDDRQKKAGTTKKNLEKLVKSAGGLILNFEPDPKAARESVKNEFAALNLKASGPAIDLLLDMTSNSVSRSLEEVQKLVLYCRNGSVTEQDVKAVVVPSRDWNIFKLLDSVISGDMSEALRQLQIVISNKTKVEDIAFSSIFPMMSRQLRSFWQARICLDAGVDPSSAPESILRQFPDKPNLAKESPYRQSAIMRGARKLSYQQLADCLALISDADARLKGYRGNFTALDTIEQMLLKMSRVIHPRP